MKTKPNTILQREASRWLTGPKARTRSRDGGPGGVQAGLRAPQGFAERAHPATGGSAGCCSSARGSGAGPRPQRRTTGVSLADTERPQDGNPPVPLPGACAGRTCGCLIPHVQEWMPGLTGAGFAWGPRSHGWSLFPQPHTGQPPHLTQSWKPVLLGGVGGRVTASPVPSRAQRLPSSSCSRGRGMPRASSPWPGCTGRSTRTPAGISVCAQGGVHCGEWAPWAWPLLLTSTWRDTGRRDMPGLVRPSPLPQPEGRRLRDQPGGVPRTRPSWR